MVVFSTTATHMRTCYWLKWFCATLFTAGNYCLHGKLTAVWNFTSVKSTKVSFTSPEPMWTLIMKLPYTEVKFYTEVKSQTGLNSHRVSCKRADRQKMNGSSFLSNFYGKVWVRFCLNKGKSFFLRGFILKPTKRA